MGRNPLARMASHSCDRRLFLASAASWLSAGVSSGFAEAAPPFLIGTTNQLTGPLAAAGRPFVAGARTYFDLVNSLGGVSGRQIVFTALDDRGNPDTAVANARELVAQGAKVLLGPISSAVSTALAPLLAEINLPMIAYTGVEQLESDQNYFAIGLDSTRTLHIIANYIKSQAQSSPKIAFLTLESPAQNLARDETAKIVEGWGWQVVEKQTYRFGATEFNAQALKITAAAPDYIIGSLVDTYVPQAVAALQRAGSKAQLVNFQAGSAEGVFKTSASPNFLAVRDFLDPVENDPALNAMREAAKTFGTASDMTSNIFTKGWAVGKIVVDALKSCGSACTTGTISAFLESLTNYDPDGLGPRISFGEHKRVGVTSGRIYRWDPGQKIAVPVSPYIEASN